jgi:pyruvate kinase
MNPGMPRRTRIVATLGPATDPPDVLRAILLAGLDVARINFSHGSSDEHLDRIARLRAAAAELGRTVAVLADLPGPKLRVRLAAARELTVGTEIGFSTSTEPVRPGDLVITEPELLADVRTGHRFLLDDGRLQLETIGIFPDRVAARVTVGGTLRPNKGVNLPDSPLSIPAMTQRDRDALAVVAKAGVDWLALSFVRTPEAADELRKAAAEVGLDVPVLAKMERPEAVDRAAAIIAAFDGVMVARGDLGVEIPLERVPTVQKRLIALARAAGKPVITATDMLDSMRENPRPTRAEAGDVANAIYDGTDAVMLSGETAVGRYPVEAVACMSRIAIEAETHLATLGHPAAELRLSDYSVDDHITGMVVELAERVGADAIITPTLSGRTARLLARHRPKAAIVAPAPDEAVLRRMALVWGLRPVLMGRGQPGDDRLATAVQAAFEAGAVRAGARVVVLAGHPVKGGEHLPTIRLARVGDGGRATEP